jgi:hypothetical protein
MNTDEHGSERTEAAPNVSVVIDPDRFETLDLQQTKIPFDSDHIFAQLRGS